VSVKITARSQQGANKKKHENFSSFAATNSLGVISSTLAADLNTARIDESTASMKLNEKEGFIKSLSRAAT